MADDSNPSLESSGPRGTVRLSSTCAEGFMGRAFRVAHLVLDVWNSLDALFLARCSSCMDCAAPQ